MILDNKARRRWFGSVCLLAAFTMLVLGETALKGKLSPTGFVVYWMGCFGFTLLAVIAALFDIRSSRLQGRRAQQQLMRDTLERFERPKNDQD